MVVSISIRSAKVIHRLNRSNTHFRRYGIVTLWLLGTIPVILMFFGVLIDISRLWLAKVELKNATEAAALSGVQTWALNGDTQTNRMLSRDEAIAAGEANWVVGQDPNAPANGTGVTISRNETVGADANDNTSADGELVLGTLDVTMDNEFLFRSDQSPSTHTPHAVRVQKVVAIYSIWANMFGVSYGPYSVQAMSVAAYYNGEPRLVHVRQFAP